MKYDFDKVIDRRNTNSFKWDYCVKRHGMEVLPMWVADMDFEAPREVIEAIIKRARHRIYGYTPIPESYYEAVITWIKNKNGWDIRKDWIISTPGALSAVGIAIQAYTGPGDRIIIQTPVYHPFPKIIKYNGRLPVINRLKQVKGGYQMDYNNLERLVAEGARLLILCSPHNPVGRVWKREELIKLAEICVKRDVLVVSDEIHSDLIMKGYTHTSIATLSDDIAKKTITLTSASKTFNLAGLSCSNIIIPDKVLFDKFNRICKSLWLGIPNIFGMVATESAYRHGEEWLEQLIDYIGESYKFLVSYIQNNSPRIKVVPLEGTYLGWLDFRDTGLSDKEIEELILRDAKVCLESGPKFGSGGEGFQRINLACPRETLKQGLERILRAIKKI